jgi:predicted aconitase with swiveling domain
MTNGAVFKGRPLCQGKASGPALVTRERLGFRGYANLEQGTFSGGMGNLEGAAFAGAVLIFPSSRGSTLWSITLDQACRFGNAPAAMVIAKRDPFVALGCALQEIPLVLVENGRIFDEIKSGDMVSVDANSGEVRVFKL